MGLSERPCRRRVLRLGLAGATALFASGHTPFGHWGVYRKRHLLILTTRVDPESFSLGERLAAVLAARLPESRAGVSRAPHKARIASLLSSKQMDVALMRRDDAEALLRGAAPYSDYGPLALRAIIGLGDFLLVCREDFRDRHAWLIAEALSQARDELRVKVTPADSSVQPHPGAWAYFSGTPLPDAGPEPDHGHEHPPRKQP